MKKIDKAMECLPENVQIGAIEIAIIEGMCPCDFGLKNIKDCYMNGEVCERCWNEEVEEC